MAHSYIVDTGEDLRVASSVNTFCLGNIGSPHNADGSHSMC